MVTYTPVEDDCYECERCDMPGVGAKWETDDITDFFYLCDTCRDEVCGAAPAKREITSVVFIPSTDRDAEKTVHLGSDMAVAGVVNKIRVSYDTSPFSDTAMVWLDCENGKVEFPLVHITAVVYGV